MAVPDLDKILLLASDTARLAAKSVLKDLSVIRKVNTDEGRDIKLAADHAFEEVIIENIKRGSEYPILSEESGASDGQKISDGYRWIIDPLDGTLNFYRGIPMSCVSISLWKGMTPVLGVVFDFERQEMFTGIVGRGAWLNGIPMKVSGISEKSKAVLCTGFPISADFSQGSLLDLVEDIRMFKKIRLFGSAALSLAYVACGRVDCYREDGIKIWDVAAGVALVKAAGGVIQVNSVDKDLVLNVEASNSVSLFSKI